jgi:hypothetical protein
MNQTVTNDGPTTLTYMVKVDAPKSLVVHIVPETLAFSKAREKKTFRLTVSTHGVGQKEELVEGSFRMGVG